MNKIKELIAKQPWLLALAAFGVVAVWMATGMIAGEPDTATESGASLGESGAPVAVQVASQQAIPVTRYINVYGNSAPARSVDLAIETEGRVEEVLARRGQQLKAGDPILRLDLRDRNAKILQAKASVREHQSKYDAQIKLQDDGYVSETQLAETLAMLESARADLTRAQLDLENMTVRAPFDGVLQEREVEVGDFIRTGDMIGTFVDNTSIIVTGTIAEQEASKVNAGDKGQAKLVTGQNVDGVVRYVSPVASRETRTFMVELEVPNTDGSLPAGVTAELLLSAGEVMAHRLSPALLTLDSEGEIGVNTVDEFDRIEFHRVEIVQSGNNGIWVSGLPSVAQVVVVGQGYVSQGQQVLPSATTDDTALASEDIDEMEQLK